MASTFAELAESPYIHSTYAMPLLSQSSYHPPLALCSGHLQTIYPALFRKVPIITDRRERIETPDGDFLDLDWKDCPSSRRLVILSHGLEGSSHQAYVQGMARVFHETGWNILAWNYRGCSGEINRRIKSYHSGATEDLHTVLNHVYEHYPVLEIALIGFSLGGNITLKYLGEQSDQVDKRIKAAVAFSVPCDLESSSIQLESLTNRIYMARFLRTLRKKIRQKMEVFPGQLADKGLSSMKTFREFDGGYTAPMHGFTSAEDYWTRSSSRPFIPKIRISSLLINALNDPFLAAPCYPYPEAEASPCFHMTTPKHGGHMGFPSFRTQNYWSERSALLFVKKSLKDGI